MAAQVPAADILRDILARDYYISRTVAGDPFAVRNDVPSVMIPLHGKGGTLRNRLVVDMLRQTGRVPNSEALGAILNLAEGIAAAKRPAVASLRIAAHRGCLYLDLGRADGWAAEIRPGRWQVVTRPPVLFMRTALTSELPLPAEEGYLDGARELVNISDPGEWALYIACRIAALFPGITHPVELFTGPAGSAKTSTTRISSDWTDPAPVMSPVPRDGRTWAAMAASRYTQPMDNVSWLPDWLSDLLCKSASGDGWLDRALYTDTDVAVASFRNVIIINGISLPSVRGDLADRSVSHRLSVPVLRASDDVLEHRWRSAHPHALAWLLDRACEIYADMQHEPEPRGTDRLVRFGQILRLMDARWHTQGYGAWQAGRRDIFEDVADSDPVIVAIRASIGSEVTMTSAELLSRLKMGGLSEHGRQSWTPKTLSERLERSQAALEAQGWRVGRYREGGSGKRMWFIAPPDHDRHI